MKRPSLAAFQVAKRVRRDAADPEDDASVLDRVVGIVEHRADAADAGAGRLAGHLVEPVAVDHLEVVVEQADDLAARRPHRAVVERGVVEGRVVAEHAHRAPRRPALRGRGGRRGFRDRRSRCRRG